MTRAQRREHNQRIAAAMKARGEERTSGRCCICYALYHADMLTRGFLSHRCDTQRTLRGPRPDARR